MSNPPDEFAAYWKVRQQEIRDYLKSKRRLKSTNTRTDVCEMSADELLTNYLQIVAKTSTLSRLKRQFITAEMQTFNERTDEQ